MKLAPAIAAAVVALTTACADGDSATTGRILLGTTHTLEDSGILDTLATQFRAAEPEARLQIVVAGSGEIMTLARRGDLDVILTHSPDDEEALVFDSIVQVRRPVMYNAFTIAGRANDPAMVGTAASATEAFLRIRRAAEPFISRGDQSGTHRRELQIWAAAGVSPDWSGYEESGAGMADVLRVASQRGAYTLTDIATLTVLEQSIDIVALGPEDPALVNQYSVMVVTGARNSTGAELFADWITSPAAHAVIARFGSPGRRLFTAGAAHGEARFNP